MSKQREPGLPSLAQARAERRAGIIRGRAKLRGELFPHFWLWAAIIIGGSGIIQWKCSADELAAEKARVMSKQRAVARVLEPKVGKATARMERWTRELAGEWPGDELGKLDLTRLGRQPGLYLRLRSEAARKPQKDFRKAAAESLQDGFSSCFFVQESAGQDPTKGKSCSSASDCEPGQYCNEYKRCRKPPEPFNLQLLYQALRVLSSEWTDRLHETANSKVVRIRDLDLQRVSRENVPIALNIMERARTFTVVLDDDPPGGLPESPDYSETKAQRVQRLDHKVRVGVWDLKSGELLGRVRVDADAQLRAMGAPAPSSREHDKAKLRQAKSCGAALQARQKLGKGSGPLGDGPAPDTLPPGSAAGAGSAPAATSDDPSASPSAQDAASAGLSATPQRRAAPASSASAN